MRFITFLSIISTTICNLSFAQSKGNFGTKSHYESEQKQFSPEPKGYKVFFVNHAGRHGSRFMTKAKEDSLLLNIFTKAAAENGLTPYGKQWFKAICTLVSIQRTNYGNITQQGAQELNGIANRLLHNTDDILLSHPVDIWYTHKKRTHQSAMAFMSAFPKTQKANWHHVATENETTLRFYDFSKSLEAHQKSEDLQNRIDTLEQLLPLQELSENLAKQCITTNTWNRWNQKKECIIFKGKEERIIAKKFAKNLIDIYGVLQSTTVEFAHAKVKIPTIDTSIVNQFELINNLATDWKIGPSIAPNGIQAKIASPLLANMILTADSAISGLTKSAGIFRFSHAEAISPLATLIGFKGDDSTFQTAQNFNYGIWNATKAVPMSANIQWIFYRNGKNILVKFLQNEKEMALPIATTQFPYYNWTEARNYLSSKLTPAMLTPNFDWKQFLENL